MLEHYEKFYLEDAASLEAECRRLGVELPVSETCDALKQSVDLGPAAAPNRIWLQPMEGMDAEPDGSPGPLTKRRYARYAEGGCGLLWLEASATAAVSSLFESTPVSLSPAAACVAPSPTAAPFTAVWSTENTHWCAYMRANAPCSDVK